jgi:hypothetical protein
MAATVTLATTTLTFGVGPSDTRIAVASTSGMVPGIRLWLDRELMTFLRLDVTPWVLVARGADGTASAPHSSTTTITLGRADQFYSVDPVGAPDATVLVQPYINVVNGTVWYPYGDETAPAYRWWQQQTTTYGIGPLGERSSTTVGAQ